MRKKKSKKATGEKGYLVGELGYLNELSAGQSLYGTPRVSSVHGGTSEARELMNVCHRAGDGVRDFKETIFWLIELAKHNTELNRENGFEVKKLREIHDAL